MRVSMKTDYALRVLFTLVENYGRGPIPNRELARATMCREDSWSTSWCDEASHGARAPGVV